MEVKTIEYFDGPQKLMGKFLSHKSNEQKPTIILFPAFEGLSPFILNYAERFAHEGYNVFVADIYGDGQVSTTLEGCFNLITPFLQDRALVRRRAQLAFAAVNEQPQVDKNTLGAMGFCFGGMCMLELVRTGANLRAAVSAHGILGKSDLPTQAMLANLLILHGYKDPQVPAAQIDSFIKEIETAKVADWTLVFLGQAKHSFTDPATGSFDPKKEMEMGREYNAIAAERAWAYANLFFQEQLQA